MRISLCHENQKISLSKVEQYNWAVWCPGPILRDCRESPDISIPVIVFIITCKITQLRDGDEGIIKPRDGDMGIVANEEPPLLPDHTGIDVSF